MEGPFFNPYAPIAIHERNLPHWQQPGALVFLTWRLADSLPAPLLNAWQTERAAWLEKNPPPWDADTEIAYRQRFSARLEDWLDAGQGVCVLQEPHHSARVEAALRHFDGIRYALDSFVIMPNHVHLIVRLAEGHPLNTIIKSWKSFSARAINQACGTTGPLWQDGYWDRLIRDQVHLGRCRAYIQKNPTKANLSASAFRLHLGTATY